MADIEKSLLSFMLLYSDIVSLVGNRIVWNTIPEGMATPLIRLRTVSDTFVDNHQSKPLSRATIEAHVLSNSKASCNDVAEKIKELFHGYRGAIGEYGRARILVRDAPSDWAQDVHYFLRTIEMDVGYA